METPWGQPDMITELGDGIKWVSTPSHGGCYMPPEKNKNIPDPLRHENGFYEEDCAWSKAAFFYPEYFRESYDQNYNKIISTPEEVKERARKLIVDFFPFEWEEYTGSPILAGESRLKEEWIKKRVKAGEIKGW